MDEEEPTSIEVMDQFESKDLVENEYIDKSQDLSVDLKPYLNVNNPSQRK